MAVTTQADTRDDTFFKKILLHKLSHDDEGITVSQRSASLLSVATLDSVTTADTGIYSRSGRDSDDESCLIDSEGGMDDLLSSDEEALKTKQLQKSCKAMQNLQLIKLKKLKLTNIY